MSREKAPNQTNTLDEKENLFNRVKAATKKALGAAGLAGVMAIGVGAGIAHADTVLLFGGHDDGSGDQYEAESINNHVVDPAKDTIIKVQYSGEMKPADNQSMRQAVDEAVANGQKVLDGLGKVRVLGTSEGAAAADELTLRNEHKVSQLVLDDPWFGRDGLGNNTELVTKWQGALDDNGIIVKEPLPTTVPTIINENKADPISYGKDLSEGQVESGFMAAMGNGAHNPMNPQAPHTSTRSGNVVLNVFDPPAGVEPLVQAADKVPEAPTSTVLANRTAPAPAPERLSQPEFNGELECPGGGFTPGDAPC